MTVRAVDTVQAAADAGAVHIRPSSVAAGRLLNVVIADDDPFTRSRIEAAAWHAGADAVIAVGDGAAAVSAVADLRPELIVLDVAMPVLSGLEACHAIREAPAGHTARLVLLAPSSHPAAVRAARHAGADLYLVKPFRVESMAQILKHLLTSRRRPPGLLSTGKPGDGMPPPPLTSRQGLLR